MRPQFADDILKCISLREEFCILIQISSKFVPYGAFDDKSALVQLTHWGWVKHIRVGNLTIIGSDNSLLPGRRQAIIWTNAGLLLIGPLGTYLSEIWIQIQFSLKKIDWKMLSGKWRPSCLGLNVLMAWHNTCRCQAISCTNHDSVHWCIYITKHLNLSLPGRNGHHFADDIFRCILVNEKFYILINISLNFVPKGPIDNNPALVEIMAWCRPGDKPLSEPMMVNLLMSIYIIWPQWIKCWSHVYVYSTQTWSSLGLTVQGHQQTQCWLQGILSNL